VAGIDLADWLVRKGLALDWPKYSRAITPPHRMRQSAPNVAFGAEVLSNLGAIALADERVGHLLAVPINHSASAGGALVGRFAAIVLVRTALAGQIV
jgi:hypothetical protein